MGIAAEIIEHLLGSAERALGVDDPANGAQRPQAGSEGGGRGQAGQIAEEPELTRLERRLEAGQEKPAVETRQHLYRQKEARAAADPAGPVGRWPTTRHDAVDMGMMMQVLSPGVQDGHQPDLGAEMPGIGSDDAQRLGGDGEQDAIDHGLIVESDLCDRRRHREDDVEVRHRQQLGLSVGQPFSTRQPLALRAVSVAAGIVGDAKPATVVALLDMTAQCCRAADFDGAHNTALAAAQMAGMGLTVSGPVAAEDIRHLQRAAHAIDGINVLSAIVRRLDNTWTAAMTSIAQAYAAVKAKLRTIVTPDWVNHDTGEGLLCSEIIREAWCNAGYRLYRKASATKHIQAARTDRIAVLNNRAKRLRLPLSDISYVLTFALATAAVARV